MEEAFFDTPLYREFAQLNAHGRLLDESTIGRFGKTPSPRHRLERYKLANQILVTVNDLLSARGLLLKAGTAVDATCRIPCDHLPRRSWALFQAREVMRGVLESLTAKQPT